MPLICDLDAFSTQAHTTTYKALKALPGGVDASVGLVHHHITFGALKSSVPYFFAVWFTDWLTYWMG